MSIPQEPWANRRPECVQGGPAGSSEELIELLVTRPRVRQEETGLYYGEAQHGLKRRPHWAIHL